MTTEKLTAIDDLRKHGFNFWNNSENLREFQKRVYDDFETLYIL